MPRSMDHGGGQRRTRWRTAAWATAAMLMLLPLIAMQVTDEVAWDVLDFAVLGALLAGAGVALEVAVRKARSAMYRAAVVVAVAAAFILTWVNGAVGVIGSEGNDANLMYAGVLATGMIGAIVARFRPAGMARALLATAFAQVLVAVIALVAGLGSTGPNWPWNFLALTGFFAALWLTSAWLFRKAAREQTHAGAAP